MNYNIYDGIVSSGIVLNRDSMYIESGGVANSKVRNCFHALKHLRYRSLPDFLRFFQNDIGL